MLRPSRDQDEISRLDLLSPPTALANDAASSSGVREDDSVLVAVVMDRRGRMRRSGHSGGIEEVTDIAERIRTGHARGLRS
jgi:hypothetical protein